MSLAQNNKLAIQDDNFRLTCKICVMAFDGPKIPILSLQRFTDQDIVYGFIRLSPGRTNLTFFRFFEIKFQAGKHLEQVAFSKLLVTLHYNITYLPTVKHMKTDKTQITIYLQIRFLSFIIKH